MQILITLLLAVMMMAGLFLLLLGGVGFVQNKSFFSSAPKEVRDAVPDTKPERFKGQHIVGWMIIVLAFARALGEYGATSMVAGYTPGKTATISTTVYQLWRINDETGAGVWVLINIAISAVFLLLLNSNEKNKVKLKK